MAPLSGMVLNDIKSTHALDATRKNFFVRGENVSDFAAGGGLGRFNRLHVGSCDC